MSYRGSNWQCPRCASPFASQRAQFADTQLCGTCGGAFISHVRVAGHTPEISAKVSARLSSIPVDGMKCPVCLDAMRRAHVETCGADVQVDYCPAHGYWFDAREYDVLRSVESKLVT